MSKKRQYFGTDGIRGRVGEQPITPEFVLKLGWAIGRVLADNSDNVLIGKDTRISGYMLESALEAGLSAAGVGIYLLGPMPTPGIAYLTRSLEHVRAGIVISASHNPYYDNGIKIFSAEGTKLPDTVELAIEKQLKKPIVTVDPCQLGKAKRIEDAYQRYIKFCMNTVPANFSLKGVKIVLDCANGSTYNIAPKIFRAFQAKVFELNVKPDGLNINDACGSTAPSMLQKMVLAKKADIGIAFDGDGDRVLMVDHTGSVVDGDELLFILAKTGQKNGYIKNGIVGTVMSNLGLELAIRGLGLDFVRTNVGDRYVLEEMLRGGWQLGGEASGHIICLGATTTGDGIVASLQVLAAMQQSGLSLHELKSGMQKFSQMMISIRVNNFKRVMKHAQVQKAVHAAEKNLANHGRILLRPSGTEPVVRVMVEGEDSVQVNDLANKLASAVRAASG